MNQEKETSDPFDKKFEYEDEFTPIEEIVDKRFGDIILLSYKVQPEQFIFAKEKVVATPEECENEIFQIQERLKLSNDNLLTMIDYSVEIFQEDEDDDQLKYYVIGYYEYMESDLSCEIKTRTQEERYFTDEELLGLEITMLEVLNYLREFKMVHGDIRPKYIFFDDSGEYKHKLLDRLGDPSAPNQVQVNNLKKEKNLYMSPALYSALANKMKKIKHNPFKSDAFSLGLVIIEAGNLKSVQNIYRNGNIDENALLDHIETFLNRYGDNNLLKESLLWLLDTQEKTRKDPRSVLKIIEQIQNEDYVEANKEDNFSSHINSRKVSYQEPGMNEKKEDAINHKKEEDLSKSENNKNESLPAAEPMVFEREYPEKNYSAVEPENESVEDFQINEEIPIEPFESRKLETNKISSHKESVKTATENSPFKLSDSQPAVNQSESYPQEIHIENSFADQKAPFYNKSEIQHEHINHQVEPFQHSLVNDFQRSSVKSSKSKNSQAPDNDIFVSASFQKDNIKPVIQENFCRTADFDNKVETAVQSQFITQPLRPGTANIPSYVNSTQAVKVIRVKLDGTIEESIRHKEVNNNLIYKNQNTPVSFQTTLDKYDAFKQSNHSNIQNSNSITRYNNQYKDTNTNNNIKTVYQNAISGYSKAVISSDQTSDINPFAISRTVINNNNLFFKKNEQLNKAEEELKQLFLSNQHGSDRSFKMTGDKQKEQTSAFGRTITQPTSTQTELTRITSTGNICRNQNIDKSIYSDYSDQKLKKNETNFKNIYSPVPNTTTTLYTKTPVNQNSQTQQIIRQSPMPTFESTIKVYNCSQQDAAASKYSMFVNATIPPFSPISYKK